MNNRERIFSALQLKQPDRVPIFDYFDKAPLIKISNVLFGNDTPMKVSTMAGVDGAVTDLDYQYMDLQIRVIKALDLDAIITWQNIKCEKLPGKSDFIKDRFGIVYRTSEHGVPIPMEGPVKDKFDLDKIATFEPFPEEFDLIDYYKERAPERVLLFDIGDPFRMCWYLMGSMEKFLPLIIIEPDFVLKLSRIAAELLKKTVEMAIERGAEVIFMEGDLAFRENILMSKDQFMRFVNVFNHEICEVAHKRGVPIIKHSDGNIWPILDELIEAGFDGIHPIEPQAMDIKEVKNHLRDKACVCGNIDCADLLVTGDPNEVVAKVKDTIKDAAPGGGYILTSSNSIHPGCNAENVVTMFNTAKKHGVYT